MSPPRAVWWAWWAGAALALAAGCGTPQKARFDARAEVPDSRLAAQFEPLGPRVPLDPAMLERPTAPYRLGVGDEVEIEIAELGGSRAITFVMPDGRVYFDLAGGVPAEGLTIPELRARLEEALARDYAGPQVRLSLREVRSRRVWVLGRVSAPGLYPLDKPTRLLEALARAGGLASSRFSGTTEELADLTRSFVIRGGRVLPVDFEALLNRGETSQNIYLEPDDYVYVPSATSATVSVLGRVRQPQAVPYTAKLTLLVAVAQARGPLAGARLEQVLIVRGSVTAPRVAVVDLGAILTGRAPDVLLAPFDLIWVPASRWSRLDELAWMVVDTAARTVAVREGAHAANYGGESGVVIPIGN